MSMRILLCLMALCAIFIFLHTPAVTWLTHYLEVARGYLPPWVTDLSTWNSVATIGGFLLVLVQTLHRWLCAAKRDGTRRGSPE